MAQVQTVRGPVDGSDLGRTYMHEHIFVLTPDVQLNYPDEWGSEEERVADAAMTQWHYGHIHDDVLPYLRDHGVTEEQIDTMLVSVPRRYFENATAY